MASELSSFLVELKRRKVYQVAAIYAGIGLAVALGAAELYDFLLLPDWTPRLVITLLLAGFPVALVLAWAYEIRPEETGTIERIPEAAGEAPASGQWKRIAVLPFDNLSDEPENEYFSDGVTEDILTRLSRVEDLHVISRTSVRACKGTRKQVREIAGELGVGTLLEGTVRRAGNRVRVSAQLIDARFQAINRRIFGPSR